MNGYNKDNESSFLMYWDANNLYWWAMWEQLLVDNFEKEKNISKFDEKFIKNHDGNSVKWIILVNVEYPKELQKKHNDLPFLQEQNES